MAACHRGEVRRRHGGLALVLLGVAAGTCLPAPVAGQGTARPSAVADTGDPLTAALDAEDRGDRQAAAVAYRRALRDGSPGSGDRVAIALLGLERVWAELGWRDSIAPVVGELLQVRPADPVARSVQLRALFALERPADAELAYLAWRRAAPPTDAAPFREYARQLLERGRPLGADSVLAEAGRVLGGSAALAAEAAQLHVALGRWPSAASAYRQTLEVDPYLEAAAQFALQRAPAAARDSVRMALLAPPRSRPARRVLASLELAWGQPRRGWNALAPLAGDDSVSATWREFAERAELAEAWLVARDVWQALADHGGMDKATEGPAPGREALVREALVREARMRGAEAALRGGDPAGALLLVRAAGGGAADSTRRLLIPLEVEALGGLGRVEEAQRLVDGLGAALDDDLRRLLARPLVTAYLQRGDVRRARAVLEGTDLQDDDETVGWLALYEGDLDVARQRLVRAIAPRPEVVDALGVLARVRGADARGLGAAFLALARRDSAQAAARFEALADSVGEGAAPAVLALAARLRGAKGEPLWTRIRDRHPASPEGAEALLALARARRAAGDVPPAIAHLESLILDHPDSALLPQARRLLEELRGRRPPA